MPSAPALGIMACVDGIAIIALGREREGEVMMMVKLQVEMIKKVR